MPAERVPAGGARLGGRRTEPVAIVGMSVLLPGAGSLEDYWQNLVNGVDSITDVPANRWEPERYDPEGHQLTRIYCRRGGFVDDLAYFDAAAFGIMPTSVRETEPDQLLALQVAAAAIEDAGGLDRLGDRDRVGVILGHLGVSGVASAKFDQRVRLAEQVCGFVREMIPELPEERLTRLRELIAERQGRYQPDDVIGLMSNFAASRITNRLGLRGTAYTLDAACASSLIAVDHAVAELASGRLDVVLAGGVHHNHDVVFWAVFNQLQAMSRRQQIRPFDAGADGLLVGEGTGVVVLKRLADAIRDGDRVHAVIRGVGVSGDGRSASLVNPETKGQALAVRRAWASAGLDPAAPDALGLLEAHGTATQVGDAAELATMAEVFGPPREGPRAVIGSVKSMIGHAMAAAGVAGLVKAALAVSRGVLPPTLHCDTPRPEMARTRFTPIPAAVPWECSGPRRAAVNSFGFGGINAHVIVEEPPAAVARCPRVPATRTAGAALVSEPEQMVMLAGPDPAAIARLLDAPDSEVRAHGSAAARNGASGNGAPRSKAAGCRFAMVHPTGDRLALARKVVAGGTAWRHGRDIWFSPRPLLAGGQFRTAFVFPGLEAGQQAQVDDIAVHFRMDASGLTGTQFTEHLAGVVKLGQFLYEVLARIGVTPDATAGHSLGEWTAGIVAGLVGPTWLDDRADTLLSPVALRPDLTHAVVGAGAPSVEPRLAAYPGVALSHDNAPSQSVVCGPADQVDRLMAELARENITCRELPFATGVHTPYLEPYVAELRSFRDPEESVGSSIPVWSAAIAAPLPDDPAQRREVFFRQLVQPVRFRPMIEAMHDAGVRVFLQTGPGQLASLIDDTLRGRDHLAIPVNVGFRSGLAQLRRVAAALWAEGGSPDLAALDPAPRPAPEPAKPARHGVPMRLELGTERTTLGDAAIGLLGTTGGDAASAQATLAYCTEFAGLLKDTTDAVAAVLTAAQTPTQTHR